MLVKQGPVDTVRASKYTLFNATGWLCMRPMLPRPLEFLTQEQITAIDRSVLRVLSEAGVRIEWKPALETFAGHGCDVDFETRVVRIPQDVLRPALATCPHEFTLSALDPAHNIHVTQEDVYTIGGASALNVLDLEGNHRAAKLEDLVNFTRLIDALPLADIMHAMVVPQDIPQPGFDRILFSTIMQSTTKHYYSQ